MIKKITKWVIFTARIIVQIRKTCDICVWFIIHERSILITFRFLIFNTFIVVVIWSTEIRVNIRRNGWKSIDFQVLIVDYILSRWQCLSLEEILWRQRVCRLQTPFHRYLLDKFDKICFWWQIFWNGECISTFFSLKRTQWLSLMPRRLLSSRRFPR